MLNEQGSPGQSITSQWDSQIPPPAVPAIQEHMLIHHTISQREQYFKHLSAGVIILDPAGTVVSIPATPFSHIPLDIETTIGKSFIDCSWWSRNTPAQNHLRQAIDQARKGNIVHLDETLNWQTHYQNISATITPQRDTYQQVEYLIYTYQEKARTDEDTYNLVNTIPQLVWMADPDGSVYYCNHRWRTYTGLTSEELQGAGWVQCLHPDDRPHTLTAWQTSIQTGELFEVEQRLCNIQTGVYRWFLVRGSPRKNEKGEIIDWVGTITDIHKQKQLEVALRHSNALWDRLVASNIIGIALEDRYGRIWEANDVYLSITGYTRADLNAGRARWDHVTSIESIKNDEQASQELQETGVCTPYEKVFQHQDGHQVPVIIGKAILEETGDKMVCFILDISERKELEKRKDEFIGIAGHELRTPLSALKMNIQLAQRRIKQADSEKSALYLTQANKQITIITDLINNLLDVSQIRMGRFDYQDQMLNLDELIRETVQTCQQTTSTHTLKIHGAISGSIIGDKRRLTQVFTNIITNAIKYSPQAHTVDIKLYFSGDHTMIAIQDYGVGIPDEVQANIFERFNRGIYGTNERAFPGLGMGLYIANEIVTHYGGTITPDTTRSIGTTFTVSLPFHPLLH